MPRNIGSMELLIPPLSMMLLSISFLAPERALRRNYQFQKLVSVVGILR